jgi:hypothetical protein
MLDIDAIRAKYFEPTGTTMPKDGLYKPSANEIAMSANGVKVASFTAGSGGRSPRLYATGDIPARVSTDGTDTTPVITETYFAELEVNGASVATGIAVMNGSVASGNIKVGLFSAAGALLASSASTAMAGTAGYQRVPFTATYQLTPGTYIVALQVDNTTARFRTHAFGNFAAAKKTGETYGTWTALTPATTFTAGQGPIASLY